MKLRAGDRAWVTGGAGGIGRAVALSLAQCGVEVLSLDVRPPETRDGRVADIQLNLADPQARAAFLAAHPPPQLLVHAAARTDVGLAETTPNSVWSAGFEVGLFAAVELVQAILPSMLAQRRGHILLLGSALADTPLQGTTAYAAQKAGVLALARGLRLELRDRHLGVSVLLPGIVRTQVAQHTAVHGGDAAQWRARVRQRYETGLSPEQVAGRALQMIARNEAEARMGMDGLLLRVVARVAPALLGRIRSFVP